MNCPTQDKARKKIFFFLVVRGTKRERGKEGAGEGELDMEPGGDARLHISQCNSSLRTAKSSVMPKKILKCLI